MRNLCPNCKYYPVSWFEKLFNLTIKYKKFAQCHHPDTMSG